ncbi:hypothetical protein [Miniimonas arenae]|nr:hypothetical protein [Miniimonas arenae]
MVGSLLVAVAFFAMALLVAWVGNALGGTGPRGRSGRTGRSGRRG